MVLKIQSVSRSTVGSQSFVGMSPRIGAEVLGATQEAAKALQTTANNIVVEHDQARTRSAFNTFRESSRQEFGRLQTLKGNNAIGENSVSEQYQGWYEKESARISDTLDNTGQQNAFKVLSDGRRNGDLDSLSVYEAGQHKAYNLSVHKGEIVSSQADTMQSYANDQKMADIEAGVTASFDLTFPGVDTSASKQKELASIKGLRIKMLSENGMVGKAQELLEQDKDELKGAYFPLKNQVDAQGVVEESTKNSDFIMSTIPEHGAQLKSARGIENADVRDATIERVKTHQEDDIRLATEIKKQSADNVTNQAIDIYRAGGNKTQFLNLVDQTRDPVVRKQLLSLGNTLYPDPGAGPQLTDFNKFIEAHSKIDVGIKNGTPLSDAELIREYRTTMTASDFEQTLKYSQEGGNIGGMKKPDVDRWFKYYTERKPEERPEAYSTYWEYIREQLEPGKTPTTDDYKKWSQEWLTSSGEFESGGLFGIGVPFVDFPTKGTRAEAIKAGKGRLKGFTPAEEDEQIGVVTKKIEGQDPFKVFK